MVKLLAERAGAKINLFLRVTGRRADGYHELDSIFLPIALADSVSIEYRDGVGRSVRLLCDATELGDPATNLASRAATAFQNQFNLDASVLIRLDKRIPVGAGLGGGSSDAGAVLRMMARLARIDAPAELHRIAISLGADVPFFLDPRPARITGIGEKLATLEGIGSMPLVLALPPFGIATAGVFRVLKKENWRGPAEAADIEAVRRGDITSAIAVNDLAAVAAEQHPEISTLIELLKSLGACAAQMTGSGSAVFGIFGSRDEAERAAQAAQQRAPKTRFVVTATIGSDQRGTPK
ncbi:MAG TPA: 4-(cytidine 5'-diphospho)-2-C-methyl-D-erythritol kinase [Candidatus Binataceae bacterium]|nr:4-(cytidine 5'-diphospho)-2-C-methyl-D-erythritol kinase [Candidatus Binataceae bacterium]